MQQAPDFGRLPRGVVVEEPFDPEKIPTSKAERTCAGKRGYQTAKNLAISTSGTSWWMSTQRQALEACEFPARSSLHSLKCGSLQDR